MNENMEIEQWLPGSVTCCNYNKAKKLGNFLNRILSTQFLYLVLMF